jgi:hypothetical protein
LIAKISVSNQREGFFLKNERGQFGIIASFPTANQFSRFNFGRFFLIRLDRAQGEQTDNHAATFHRLISIEAVTNDKITSAW